MGLLGGPGFAPGPSYLCCQACGQQVADRDELIKHENAWGCGAGEIVRCYICGCTEARSCALHSTTPDRYWLAEDPPLCSGCKEFVKG